MINCALMWRCVQRGASESGWCQGEFFGAVTDCTIVTFRTAENLRCRLVGLIGLS